MFKRGIDTYAEHVCRRRRDGSQFFPLFVLFVLFGQAKRTLKEKNHKVTFLLSYFCMTKSTKSHIRGVPPLIYLPLSPRGDQCEQSAPTLPLQHSHGYRFETLKRRLGFAAVPCQAMANLAVQIWVRVWVRT